LDLPFWQFNLQEDDASFCPDSFCFMILCGRGSTRGLVERM
jgi:hypothetical protein